MTSPANDLAAAVVTALWDYLEQRKWGNSSDERLMVTKEGMLGITEQHLAPTLDALAAAQRMRDLVRQQRAELHQADLITDEEYAELCSDAGAVARLESYDEIRGRLGRAEDLLRRSEPLLDELARLRTWLERLAKWGFTEGAHPLDCVKRLEQRAEAAESALRLAKEDGERLLELRAAVLAHERITDTEYGLGKTPDEEAAYNPEFLRLLRALRATQNAARQKPPEVGP